MTKKDEYSSRFGQFEVRPLRKSAASSFVNIPTLVRERHTNSSNSPRDAFGRIIYRPNPLQHSLQVYNNYVGVFQYGYHSKVDPDIGTGSYPIEPWLYRDPTAYDADNMKSAFTEEADWKALTKFNDAVRSQSMELLNSLLDGQKTIDMVKTTALRLAAMYRRLKRPSRYPPLKTVHAGDLWLEAVYGWLPLLSDVHALVTLSKKEPPPPTVRGSGIAWPQPSKGTRTIPFPPMQESAELVSKTTCTSRYRCKVVSKIRITDPAKAFAAQMGLTDPASIVWEALPYSFVVDWFLPIQSWLQLQETPKGIELWDINTTRTLLTSKTVVVNGRVKASADPEMGYTCDGNAMHTARIIQKVRTIGAPVFNHPPFKSPLSVTHALSALALLRQTFKDNPLVR